MTEKDLFREIGSINEKYIEEAGEFKKAKILTPAFKRTLATAACLCVCVGVYFGTRGLRGDFTSKESAADMSYEQNSAGLHTGATADSAYSNSATMESAAEDIGGFFENILDGFAAKEEVSGAQSAEQDSASVENYYTESDDEETTIRKEQEELGEGMGAVKKLADYSNDYEELCKEDAFVVTHGEVTAGYEKWEAFLNGYEQGKEVLVDVIRFTVEGDAIITRIWYENGAFHIIEDSTRDAWGVGGYAEYTFEGINLIKDSDGTVQVVFADAIIYDIESVNPEEISMYFLVEYRVREMTRESDE